MNAVLANIVNGRPSKDAERKTTLIVSSPAILSQWESEALLHVEAGFRFLRYTSASRPLGNTADQYLSAHDFVFTSYNEVMKSYPKNVPPISCQTAEDKIKWWKKEWAEKRGPLHRMIVSSQPPGSVPRHAYTSPVS